MKWLITLRQKFSLYHNHAQLMQICYITVHCVIDAIKTILMFVLVAILELKLLAIQFVRLVKLLS